MIFSNNMPKQYILAKKEITEKPGRYVTQSLVLCFVDRCLLFWPHIVLSVLRFTDSYYPFGIFKFFLNYPSAM